MSACVIAEVAVLEQGCIASPLTFAAILLPRHIPDDPIFFGSCDPLFFGSFAIKLQIEMAATSWENGLWLQKECQINSKIKRFMWE